MASSLDGFTDGGGDLGGGRDFVLAIEFGYALVVGTCVRAKWG